MKPVIALVGRPNVGKSTLFNRFTRTRDALVADLPGLTRDRQYGEGRLGEHQFIVIDTGGLTGGEEGIDAHMADQSMQAVKEADIVLFMVDAHAGVTPADENLAKELRSTSKNISLVVNKIDGMDFDVVTAEFYRLGLGQPYGIAAAHNRGVSALIGEVIASAAASMDEDVDSIDMAIVNKGIKIAAVGRPNVGKSTLINRMLGEDRVVVYDQAGTTRDSVYIPYERDGQAYTLIDTAGVRRRGKVSETVEKFSVIKTLQAIQDANVVVLVLDARENIVEQDLHLLGFVLDAGRSLVIAVNKWDGMDSEEKADVKKEIQRRMGFVDFAKMHFISALHGTGVGNLYESINRAYESSKKSLSASFLTKILEDAIADHQPPMSHGRRIKLRYAHMGGSNPPTVVIHGNQTNSIPHVYRRYLENTFRRVMKLEGTPIRIEFKTGDNPFATRKTRVTPRQAEYKRRVADSVKTKKQAVKKKKKRR
ncbi:ribosome biogenesis GTPase Der [Gammaproteobacteria bacterium 42_54_T18]|nr:ribosome biogenesis GTPase Der [Gammaproteobacteria bacterium 42_54_T18]